MTSGFVVNKNPSFDTMIRFGEVSIMINKITHIIPSKWLNNVTGLWIKSMEDSRYVPEGSEVYYKLPDIPGNDREWHLLQDNEKIECYPSMEFQIVTKK